MGAENSKNEPSGPRSNNNDEQRLRDRVFTLEDVETAVQYQRRLYEEKLLRHRSRIYPNLQSEETNRPSTSNNYYNATASAPPEFLVRETTAQTSRQSRPTTSSFEQAAPIRVVPYSQGTASLSQGTASVSQGIASVSQGTASVSQGTAPKQFVASNRRRYGRSLSRPNTRNNNRLMVNCVTCNEPFGNYKIFQCMNGHSSCEGCRFKTVSCAKCSESISDMRNITLETTIADMTINNEVKQQCRNARQGCRLHFATDEMQDHLKECPFTEISCPTTILNDHCNWKGMIIDVAAHFKDVHPEHCQAGVNRELYILLINLDYKVLHLVNIGPYHFLVHIQIDKSTNNMYMVTLFLGTKCSASKWIYELHIYKKSEPRRKFEYIDTCQSNVTPVTEIIDSCNCAVINIKYAQTFLDCGKLTYKVYIKKKIIINKFTALLLTAVTGI